MAQRNHSYHFSWYILGCVVAPTLIQPVNLDCTDGGAYETSARERHAGCGSGTKLNRFALKIWLRGPRPLSPPRP